MTELVIIAEAEVDPAEIERVRTIGERMIVASRAEAGCLSYAYSFDLLQPNLMRVIEVWTSEQALREHFATSHMATFRRDLAATRTRLKAIKVHELGKEGKLPS